MPRCRSIAAFALAGALVMALPQAPGLAQGAAVEEVATATALVHDVDLTSRQVLVETEDGRFVTLVAPEEVRNLPQLAVGDTLTIGYYGGIAASLAPAGGPPIETSMSDALIRAEEGERPAGAAISEVVTTVTFDAYDAATGVVTFTGQSGIQRTVAVEDPEMRAFVETLEAGDQVDVHMVEILAIVVE